MWSRSCAQPAQRNALSVPVPGAGGSRRRSPGGAERRRPPFTSSAVIAPQVRSRQYSRAGRVLATAARRRGLNGQRQTAGARVPRRPPAGRAPSGTWRGPDAGREKGADAERPTLAARGSRRSPCPPEHGLSACRRQWGRRGDGISTSLVVITRPADGLGTVSRFTSQRRSASATPSRVGSLRRREGLLIAHHVLVAASTSGGSGR